MKSLKIFSYVLIIIALLWPGTAFAKDLLDDKVVFGGTFTLEEGDTLNGNLVVFGGTITLEADSTVNGDVVLIGGIVDAMGTINGNMVGIGGVLELGEDSRVHGDLVTVGAALNRLSGAEISGQVIQGLGFPFRFNIPGEMEFDEVGPPNIEFGGNPALDVVWFFFRMFIWAALAVLLVIFFSTQTERVTQAALDQPLITAGAGLLTAILAPLALVALAITIILIPVAFVAIVLLGVAWLMGWVALGLEVGRRIAKMLNQEWAPAIAAGVGTLVLYFVLAGFDQLVPCVGGLPRALVGLWGLGAVLMTYFGTREFHGASPTAESAPQIVEVIVAEEEKPEVSEDSLPEDGLASEQDSLENAEQPEDETPEDETKAEDSEAE
jgi:hypothetical protein